MEVLRNRFGYSAFRPGQEVLVRAVLRGRDALGVLPTGGGKSLCYQVPAALLPGLTLVVSPLISLMEDQAQRAEAAGLPARVLHSGLSAGAREAVVREVEAGGIRILLVAPERLRSPGFASLLGGLKVSLLTIDEAHCISSWGHDFRPAYRELGRVRGELAVCAPILALTATATPRVREDMERVLALQDPERVVQSFDRPNLHWAARRLPHRAAKLQALAREIWDRRKGSGAPGAILVYASTRRGVEGIRDALARMGLPALRYHAGLPPDERSRVQELFLGSKGPVVVATNAFGMGIDRSDVRLVVHAELPRSLEDFYQEAGRGGRDGGPARSLVLDEPGDAVLRRRFMESALPPTPGSWWARLHRAVDPGRRMERERRRSEEERLAAAEGYVVTRHCRRRHLLRYFGEEVKAPACGNCDRCPPTRGGPGCPGV